MWKLKTVVRDLQQQFTIRDMGSKSAEATSVPDRVGHQLAGDQQCVPRGYTLLSAGPVVVIQHTSDDTACVARCQRRRSVFANREMIAEVGHGLLRKLVRDSQPGPAPAIRLPHPPSSKASMAR